MFTIPNGTSVLVPSTTGQRFAGAVPSVFSDWIDVIEAGGLDDADNGGSRITRLAHIVLAQKRLVDVRSRYTGVKFRWALLASATITQAPAIMPFGVDGNGVIHPLVNSADADTLTLSAVPTNYTDDGTLIYSCPVSTDYFDLDGSSYLIVGVKTPITGVGAASAKLQAKLF